MQADTTTYPTSSLSELPYKFLPNTPIGKDLFEGQSQEKIADTLTNILKKEDFQIIGIDGGWGTGKSNLVKIIENKLHNDYSFFIYDVWGHQEDDQRKAILIELTEFIADAKRKIVKEPDKWGDKQKRLLSKHKEVTTTNTPYLSIGFILSLFLIIYIPTVNTFAKDLSSLWLKSLLVLLPLLLLPIIFGIKFCRNLKKSGQNEKKRFLGSIKLSIQQTMQIYGNKQTDETKFELISENEPSVKDFRDWMRDIDSDLATNNKNLVIVFDNFDRLPKKNIQSIWSSVHIFFSDEKYKKIKVLIPFDRNHIKTAFREHNDNSTEVDYANDYINKTFDLVYRISPPIMSNWKAFFKTCWDNAFQGVFGDDEYIKSEQAYEAYCKTITPREIIAFINEVVSLKLIHPNIPTRYISVFVLNKYSILKDPLKAIVEKSFLASLSYQYKDDEEFSKFITALSYQIDPDNALEIVYRGKLKEALTSSDVNDLNEISKTLVFSKIIFPLLEEIENFDKPLLALSQLTSEAKISAVEKQHLWDNIYLLQKDKNIEEAHLTEPQKLLFQNVGTVYKKTWAKKIIDGIYNHQDFSSLKFADAIDGLSNICSDNAYGIDLNEMLAEKIVPASDFIPLIKNKKAQYEKYRIQVDGDELDQYLSEHVMVNDTDIVQYLTKRYTLETFKVALTTKINEYKSDQVQLAVLFKTLKNLHKNRSNININSLLRDADIYSLFTNSKPTEDFYFDLIAMRIARGLNFDPSYQAPFVSILNTPDETITNKVAERVEYYISHDDLLMSSLDFSNELVKNVVRNIVKTSYQTQFASVSTLIKAFDRICKTNEIDPSIFITHLDGWPPPEFDKPLVKSIPESFYINAQASDCDLAKLALAGLKNYFLELTEEEWVSIFENTKQEDFRLLQALQYSDWNSFSLEALKKVLLKICKTGIIGNQSDMHAVLESFEINRKDLTNTFKDIRDTLITDRSINVDLFLFFGRRLFKYANLKEKAGDVFRTILTTTVLENSDCILILKDNYQIITELFKNSTPNSYSDFSEAITDRRDNNEIEDFAKLLGIKKIKKKTTNQVPKE